MRRSRTTICYHWEPSSGQASASWLRWPNWPSKRIPPDRGPDASAWFWRLNWHRPVAAETGDHSPIAPRLWQNARLRGRVGARSSERSTRKLHGKRRCDRIRGHGGGNPSEHHVPRATRERPRDHCPHLRADAQELHPHPDRRQGEGRNDPLRPDQGSHHLSHEVIATMFEEGRLRPPFSYLP